jgi:bifunctional N-acetylglucosamine-1-phosphate-uridyltransferase/glucosamine-1-phosphate-acetyltransferase GlmU-like protein
MKHQIHIQDEVLVGDKSTLVAPLVIGSKAMIAAGSVITDDVPQNALAIGRSRQNTNLAGPVADSEAESTTRERDCSLKQTE